MIWFIIILLLLIGWLFGPNIDQSERNRRNKLDERIKKRFTDKDALKSYEEMQKEINEQSSWPFL